MRSQGYIDGYMSKTAAEPANAELAEQYRPSGASASRWREMIDMSDEGNRLPEDQWDALHDEVYALEDSGAEMVDLDKVLEKYYPAIYARQNILAKAENVLNKEAQATIDILQGIITPFLRAKAGYKAKHPIDAIKEDPVGAAHGASELAEVGILGKNYVAQGARPAGLMYRGMTATGQPFAQDAATRTFLQNMKPGSWGHAKKMMGLTNHKSTAFLGHGAQRVVGPLWAGSMGYDALKTVGVDPRTGKWSGNIPGNMAAQANAADKRITAGDAGRGKQVARGAVEGAFHPGQTLVNYQTSLREAPMNAAVGLSKLGPTDFLRQMVGKGTKAPDKAEVSRANARHKAKLSQAKWRKNNPQLSTGQMHSPWLYNKGASQDIGLWWTHLQKHADSPNPIPNDITKYDRPEGQERDPKSTVPDDQRQPLKPGVSDPKDSER